MTAPATPPATPQAILSEPPVFIVGAGRSGTTLLRTLLSAHPRLAVTPETHFMAFAGRGEDGDAPVGEAFWATLAARNQFRDVGVRVEDVRALAEVGGPAGPGAVLAAILEAYARKEGKPRAGEKTPGHYRDVDRLLSWFPEARFLYVVRDPRAVVASALAAPWVEGKMRGRTGPRLSLTRLRGFHVVGQSVGWQRIYGEVLPRWRDHPQVLTVAYEALVTDVEAEARRACAFLGEAWSPQVVEGRGGVSGAAGGGSFAGWTARHEAKAAAPVTTGGIDRWRERLSGQEVATVEAICAETMSELGYALAAPAAARRRAGLAARAASGLYEREKQVRRVADGAADVAARFARGGARP